MIEVTPSQAGIWLKITAIAPDNYLRNIRVIPAAFETSYQSQIFNPDFIERVKNFKVFRLMEWMNTNDSETSQWSDRPTLDSARYSQDGVPVEILVELANRTNIDPWFCMPHLATDEYIAKFAEYVKDHLNAERKIYVEYSNEVWNSKFEQHRWAVQQAKARGKEQWIDWYGQRTTEIMQIWDRVFAEDKDRIVGTMAGHSANAWLLSRALSYAWSDNPLSHEEYGIDAIAIAPYFGYYLGSPDHQAQIAIWTTQVDGGLDLLFKEISQGGVLDNSPKNGALQEAYEQIKAHASLAQKENLQLLAYEGGQHLAGVGSVENNDRITQLFIQANRDSRMGEIYRDYLQTWFELGGSLFLYYNDISQPSRWGSWGLLESVSQKSSPKYDAALEALQQISSN
ncbi:MAG: cellulose-binding protein [Hydrococcus sp. RU_2_2]|nr:cellulose-binding protein [Hydrococcus sp. RU_2_2]